MPPIFKEKGDGEAEPNPIRHEKGNVMETVSRHLTDFYIAGMRYWDGAKVIGKLKPGKKLTLVAEPQNPHDPGAVAILRKGVKLGYVPAAENGLISQLLHFGHADVLECRVISVDSTAEPWKQVRAGVYITDATGSKAAATQPTATPDA